MRIVGRFRRSGAVDRPGRPAGPALPPRPTLIGTRGIDVSGVRPDGTTIEMTVTGGSIALLFLTGSCYGCQALWEGAASGANGQAARPLPVPLVIVTPSPTTEDPRLVATLAPARIPVVMSSDVWHAYEVARAPWYVGVADGTVVAHGLAPETWSELIAELARLRVAG